MDFREALKCATSDEKGVERVIWTLKPSDILPAI